jgi:hypothetical protein
MRLRVGTILVTALLCLAPSASWADLAPYSQDFEGLVQDDPGALAADGWRAYANVFGPDWNYWYGYGHPAPNDGSGFSGIDIGQGGPAQGDQQLVVYSDYNNDLHGIGAHIESNVFQEQVIGAADVGSTWRFEFDAKRGNITGDSTATAFIKTLNPADWSLSNFITADMTHVPNTWGSYTLDLDIDSSLVGHILQIGFLNWATYYEGSGIFYDNIGFDLAPLSVNLDIRPEGCPNPITGRVRGLLPAALLGTGDLDVTTIDVSSLQLEGVAPILSGLEDVATPFAGDLCGCNEVGPDGFLDLTLKFRAQDFIDAIAPLQHGERVLTLTGTLLDGTEIEGQDCIIVVGGGGSGGRPEAVQRRSTSRGVEAPADRDRLDLRAK